MALEFDESQLNEFGAKIGLPYQLPQFTDALVFFYENNYPRIVQFFSGRDESISREDVESLNNLVFTFKDLSHKILNNEHIFTTYREWLIADYFEDVFAELIVVTKISKFLRSARTNYNFDGRIEFSYITAARETIEEIANKVLGEEDYNNEWVDIAIRNDIDELSFDLKGGNRLFLGVKLTSNNSSVRGVIDNISGNKILGLDIKKSINFIDDDLEILGHNETASQSVDILAGLHKGDIPEDRTLGRTPVVGSTKNAIIFSTIIRELVNVFSSDDTLEDFTVKSIEEQNSGDFKIVFEVATRTAQIINNNTIA